MTNPHRKRLAGIHSVDDIKDRCTVDDITGCWVWRGARDAKDRPSMWLPALRRTTSLGLAICVLSTGFMPDPGVYWHCVCETRDCANPAHRRAGTRSSQMLAAKVTQTPATRARIAATKRKASRLSEADVEHIRTGGLSLKEISAVYGICISYACDLRLGRRRAMLAAPGSSVFTLGQV
ncbi:MAG: hypothetical protein HY855_25095 [Burkholderiales bacterium]|nr:hypothetical protein [Burkholderiales bacterium]